MPDNIYYHKPEVWDEKKCAKIVKRRRKDAYGTLAHLPGFIYGEYGTKCYNGGCVCEGKWYEGEHRPLPTVPDKYIIVYEPTWFYRLILKSEF